MEMLALTWGQWAISIVFLLVCLLLIMVILLQKGRGGGLSGAFGGVGGHSAFGAKTGDVFTWITVALTGLFILVAVVGNYVFVPESVADDQPAAVVPVDDGDVTPAGGGQATRPE